jgi:hypothetical protein
MAAGRDAAAAQLELAWVQRGAIRDETAFMALYYMQDAAKCAVDPLPAMPAEEPARRSGAASPTSCGSIAMSARQIRIIRPKRVPSKATSLETVATIRWN